MGYILGTIVMLRKRTVHNFLHGAATKAYLVAGLIGKILYGKSLSDTTAVILGSSNHKYYMENY